MTIVFSNSEQLKKIISLPEINEACTVSVMLVDYITDGQKTFFKSRQWSAKEGLANSTLTLGKGLELTNSIGDMELVTKIDNQQASWNNFVKLVITINNLSDKELYRFEDEYIEIPDIEVENTLQLANTQFSGSCDALLSFERFLTFARHKNPVSYIGKSIFISGCGTGAEALICMELGAKCRIGYDIDHAAIEFASKRFQDVSEVTFTSSLPQCRDVFDLVISRHVLEHVPMNAWGKYFSELGDLLKTDGDVLIDVPNQRNPREPHTELLFFHLLSEETKNKIVEYCEATKPAWYLPIKDKMNALIEHKNVELADILKKIPANFAVKSQSFIDLTSENYTSDMADGIRVVLQKVEPNLIRRAIKLCFSIVNSFSSRLIFKRQS